MSDAAFSSAPEARAEYLDGRTAGRRRISVRISGETLTLYDERGQPEARWPLATIRRAPGSRAAEGELRLAPDFDGEERLTVADPEMIRAIKAAAPGLDARRPAPRGLIGRFLLWTAVAVGSVLAILFVIAPMLADSIAPLIPAESEQVFGQKIADEIIQGGVSVLGIEPGVCHTAEGQRALAKLTGRLEKVAGAHVPLRVRVLESEMPNAFALPGGQIFLLSGLLKTAGSAEEAAGVLAHEIGHVIARDPSRNVLRGFASGVVISYVLGDFTGGFLVVALAETAVNARYSRQAEADADKAALRLLEAADLPARPFAGFFTRIRELFGDDDGYLATHPASSDRERRIVEAAQNRGDAGEPALTEVEWRALQSICD